MAPLSLTMLAAVAPAVVVASSPMEGLFRDFEEKFERHYGAEEREGRLAAFSQNLKRIESLRQVEGGSAVYSHLTPFADLTTEEFAARNGFKGSEWRPSAWGSVELQNVSTLPADFDWRAKGAVNPVKDQAQCGSCWAFATVANIEGAGFVTNQRLLSLSEQELVDCDTATGDQGCGGGLPAHAYEDMIQNGIGLEREAAYPYTAQDGTCQSSKALEVAFISGWKSVSQNEDQIAAVLMTLGPLAIGINAGPMQLYSGGIANPSDCDPQALDHGVAIVGFGKEQSQKFWIIRNSWGRSWGEDGYYRIIRGTGACGLNTMVASATGISFKSQDKILV